MIPGLNRARNEGCLSDLRLDAIVTSVEHGDSAAADAHLETCASCANRLAAFRAEKERFASASFQPRAASLARARRKWVGPMFGAASTLALAATIFLVLRSGGEGERTRGKGGSMQLGFYVEEGGRVRRGFVGERVHPSDRLQFVYTTNRPGQLIVLSVDGEAKGSIYVDDHVEPTSDGEVSVPHAIELDGVLGRERLLGLFCKPPVDVERLRRDFTRARDGYEAPDSCQAIPLTIVKVAKDTP